jgi:hypothetical protein
MPVPTTPCHPLGGTHVVGCIPNKANRSRVPESATHLADPLAKNIHPQLTIIREAAELEIFRQRRRFQLEPANRFQIAGANS